jgi:Leucine-rich repeat (LRR) protein
MSKISIKLSSTDSNDPITQINCGKSSPRLGGTIDISNYTGLTSFVCDSNDVTAIYGYENNKNLKTLSFFDNKITGSLNEFIGFTGLETFHCYSNQLTGSIPDLRYLLNLKEFHCYNNSFSGQIPDISNSTKLVRFNCYLNNLSGEIPYLANLLDLEAFNCYVNDLSGQIPDITNLTKLKFFRCYENALSGAIPNLSNLTQLQVFNCAGNNLTSFAGGSISNTIQVIQIHNNYLTSADVDTILAALVANNATGRTLYMGGSNQLPTAAGDASILTLLSRGWTIIIYPP